MSTTVDTYLAHMGLEVGDELKHYGKKGMKWGVRRERPSRLEASKTDTDVTKKVKADYNSLDDNQFQKKYATSKDKYAKRVEKHGDPYAAKNSAKNREIYEARDRQMERGAELQRQAFKTYSANGEKAAKAAMNKYEKMELELLANPDAQTAAKMTSGEKVATAVNGTILVASLVAAVALTARR